MARSKWFSDLTPATPAPTAARRVLAARLGTVQRYLGRVTAGRGEKPEDVHQLRVATRRLAAAISVFKPLLNSHLSRRLRRAARRVRRAAGSVRDLDVQRTLLEGRLKAGQWIPLKVGKALLCGLDRECRRAQQALAQVAPRWGEGLSSAAKDVLGSLEVESPTRSRLAAKMGKLSRVVLRERLDRLFEAGRADLADFDNLHRQRIRAKRLRYAMEVFAGCYPAEFRGGVYKQVESIQSDLGHVNDLRNLVQTLVKLRPRVALRSRPVRQAVTSRLIDRLTEEIGQELRERQHEFIIRWPVKQRELRREFKRFLGPRVII